MEELQRIRQKEEEERLEGLSGMSWKEKGITLQLCLNYLGWPRALTAARHREQNRIPVTEGQEVSPDVEVGDV